MTPQEQLAEIARLQAELTQIKSETQKVKSKSQKKVGNTLYVPMSRTGEALKAASEYTELELLEFKQKNLRKRAKELRDTAAWNIQQAEALEKQANEDVQKDINNLKLILYPDNYF